MNSVASGLMTAPATAAKIAINAVAIGVATKPVCPELPAELDMFPLIQRRSNHFQNDSVVKVSQGKLQGYGVASAFNLERRCVRRFVIALQLPLWVDSLPIMEPARMAANGASLPRENALFAAASWGSADPLERNARDVNVATVSRA